MTSRPRKRHAGPYLWRSLPLRALTWDVYDVIETEKSCDVSDICMDFFISMRPKRRATYESFIENRDIMTVDMKSRDNMTVDITPPQPQQNNIVEWIEQKKLFFAKWLQSKY